MVYPRIWIRVLAVLGLTFTSLLLGPTSAAHADDVGVLEGIVRVDSEPLAGVEVFLGIGFGEGSESRHVCTESDGTFRFEGVPLYTPLISATGVAIALDCPNSSFVVPDGRAGLIQYYDHVNMTEGPPDPFSLDTDYLYITYDVLPWPSSGNAGIDKIPPRVYQAIHDSGLDEGVTQEARELLFHYMERIRTLLDQGKLTEPEAEQLLNYADFVLNMGFPPDVFYINPPHVWPRDGSAILFVPEDTEIVIRTGWGACTKGLTEAYTKQSEILLKVNGEPLVPDLKASRAYWGPVEPRYIGPDNACVNGTDTLYRAYWEYLLGVLEPGEYFVEFSWGVDHPFQDGGDYDGDGKPDVGLWSGETAFTILVTPVGSVSGHVYDDMDNALEGINVVACEYEGEEPYCNGTLTDPDGYYEIFGLPPGGYRIFTTPQDYWVEQFFDHTPMWEESASIEVYPDDVTTGIDFHLISGGTISGNVSELGGGGLEGIDVIFCDWFIENYCWGGPTDENGDYQSPALLPSDYRVFVYQQGEWVEQFFDQTPMWDEAIPVEVIPMDDTGGIDFYLEEGGAISGFVSEDGGGPIEGLDVIACDYYADWRCWGVWTDGDGYYRIRGLPSAEYRVFVYQQDLWVEQFFDHTSMWDDALAVEVLSGSEVENIHFDLMMGGAVSGFVFEDGGGPIEGLDVVACDYVDDWLCWGAQTDGDGYYRIAGIPPGSYRVFVYQQWDWVEQFYDHEMWWDEADEVIVSAGLELLDIHFDLLLGGSISGQVRDETYVGLENIDVIACNMFDKCRGAMTGTYGFYTIMGVVDDTYKVLVYEQAGWQEQFYDMADWGSATTITISGANHVGGIDFLLFPLP